MRLHTVVALTDFSTAAEHAVDRAAQLAAAHQARLHLLYAAQHHDPRFADPQARLEQRARQLGRRHGLPVTALHGAGQGVVADALQAAAQADLLVLDRRMQSGWHAWWRPCVLAQLLRRAPCPVLVVQQPAQGAYGHVLVALDAAPAVPALLRYAGALEVSARVELFHACPVRGPCDATLAYRSQEQWRVRLSDAFEARRNRVDLRVGAQDLARQLVVQQPAQGAYGHVLVALDAAPAVPALLRYAGALEVSARVELFHACPVRGPCDATLAYRSQEQWRVRLSDAFEARRNRVDLRVGGQDLARQLVVQQERVGADLIVLGHRRRGLLTETLRGAVARRLLQGVRCDVLVVPHDGASQPQERRQAVAAPGWG